ncbi:hypothetical protein [Francisella tularensis]|uniref:hypothetical protein n=1 Tax=Francisella tularensis TaxID=263 RepID=UPI000158B37D|nr:hypothetical protein [Francisella tularensis]AJI73674.1 hypothetical protein AQ14_432 [Francisella tularensis subsp. novicida D9876]EDN37258.1 conserved hypothetical protein [Francisella tularensis subsp. novicida GA99-3548]MBK2112289.1 hypothetical protein [Francisella tularensis subsp. novicida FSC159]MBK2335110.1 hypothetical protein [Francisella tularensis subsp. novicida]
MTGSINVGLAYPDNKFNFIDKTSGTITNFKFTRNDLIISDQKGAGELIYLDQDEVTGNIFKYNQPAERHKTEDVFTKLTSQPYAFRSTDFTFNIDKEEKDALNFAIVGGISFDYKPEDDKQKLKVEINNVAIAQGSNNHGNNWWFAIKSNNYDSDRNVGGNKIEYMYKKSRGSNKDQCFFFKRGKNTNNEIIITSGNCVNNW